MAKFVFVSVFENKCYQINFKPSQEYGHVNNNINVPYCAKIQKAFLFLDFGLNFIWRPKSKIGYN